MVALVVVLVAIGIAEVVFRTPTHQSLTTPIGSATTVYTGPRLAPPEWNSPAVVNALLREARQVDAEVAVMAEQQESSHP